MPEEMSLSSSDIHLVVRTLSEAAALDGDARVRKYALADRVAQVVEADRWLWLVSRYRESDDQMMYVSLLHRGYDERDLAMFLESVANTSAPVLDHPQIVALCRKGHHFTRRRHELIPDAEWRTSRHYHVYRQPMGLDEYLYSIRPMSEGLLSGIGFHRNMGRPAFDDRHALLAHTIFSAADALHLMDLPDQRLSDVLDLPPRVRTTFGLLVEGLPRKKIARHLGVSPNTVAEYASRVYRHFGVAGQRELMLLFRNGDTRTATRATLEEV
jgi:DNA-binding CsgD family transcriptional regulator